MKLVSVRALVFLFLSSFAVGQVHSDIATQNTVGNWVKVVPGALVYVCDPNTADASCLIGTGGTTLYTTSGLTTPTTQPITADSNGNYTFYATPGIYKQCVKGTTSYCQQIQVAGIGTQNGIPFNCPAAVNGSVVGMTSTITSSCDPNGITDFVGHWTSQSYRATGSFNGTVELTGGLSDPTNAPDTNSVAFLAPTAVPTPYYLRPPASVGAVGQCLDLLTQTASTNGTINALSWATCGAGSGSVTSFSAGNLSPLFTTSVATATTTPALSFALSNAAANTVLGNLTGSSGAPSYTATQGTDSKVLSSGTVSGTAQSLCTDANGGATTSGCPTGGLPTTQMSNPTAPNLQNQNAAGARSITYKVVALERIDGVYHSAESSTATIANANASPQVLLTAYGDTLYAANCFDVYVTADSGGRALGLIAHCVGKKFIDIGTAGASPATLTNNSILEIDMNANPGCNVPLGGHLMIDSPPCSPTAFDDEMRQTFGVPADSQDPFYSWVNQGTSTAQWSGGALILTGQNSASPNYRFLGETLPGSAPWTFVAYIDTQGSAQFAQCGVALQESATGKLASLIQFIGNPGSGQGVSMDFKTYTSPTGTATDVYTINQFGHAGIYIKIQDNGSNYIYSWSNDGIAYSQVISRTITQDFTTAADHIGFSSDSYTATPVCVIDYLRRTQ